MTGTWGFAPLLPRKAAIFDATTTTSGDHIAVLALAPGQVQLDHAHADRHALRVMKYNAALPRARLHAFCWQCRAALQYADKK